MLIFVPSGHYIVNWSVGHTQCCGLANQAQIAHIMAWLEDVVDFQSVGHTQCSGFAIQHIVLTALHLLFWAVAFASSRMGSVQRSRVNLWCGKSKGKEVVAIVFFFCFCCRSHALLWVGNPGHCVDCTGFGALGSGVWTLANRDFSDYVDRLINYFVSQKTCQHYKDN